MIGARMQMAAGVPQYVAGGSILFSKAGAEYTEKTYGGDGNLDVHAVSMWLKRTGGIGGQRRLFGLKSDNPYTRVVFTTGNEIAFEHYNGSYQHSVYSSGFTITDTTTWHHLLWHYNSGAATASDRIKLWVDGTLRTLSNLAASFPALNTDDLMIRAAYPLRIGSSSYMADDPYADCRLSEVAIFDGVLPAVTDVRDAATGKPKDLSGLTFGTYGGWYDMKTAPGTSNGAGTDVSGNGNHYTDSASMTSGDWSGSDYPGA